MGLFFLQAVITRHVSCKLSKRDRWGAYNGISKWISNAPHVELQIQASMLGPSERS